MEKAAPFRIFSKPQIGPSCVSFTKSIIVGALRIVVLNIPWQVSRSFERQMDTTSVLISVRWTSRASTFQKAAETQHKLNGVMFDDGCWRIAKSEFRKQSCREMADISRFYFNLTSYYYLVSTFLWIVMIKSKNISLSERRYENEP